MKHWLELKIDRVENLSIENWSNKLNKKSKSGIRLKITQVC